VRELYRVLGTICHINHPAFLSSSSTSPSPSTIIKPRVHPSSSPSHRHPFTSNPPYLASLPTRHAPTLSRYTTADLGRPDCLLCGRIGLDSKPAAIVTWALRSSPPFPLLRPTLYLHRCRSSSHCSHLEDKRGRENSLSQRRLSFSHDPTVLSIHLMCCE